MCNTKQKSLKAKIKKIFAERQKSAIGKEMPLPSAKSQR